MEFPNPVVTNRGHDPVLGGKLTWADMPRCDLRLIFPWRAISGPIWRSEGDPSGPGASWDAGAPEVLLAKFKCPGSNSYMFMGNAVTLVVECNNKWLRCETTAALCEQWWTIWFHIVTHSLMPVRAAANTRANALLMHAERGKNARVHEGKCTANARKNAFFVHSLMY